MNQLGNKNKKSLRASNIELESRDISVSADDKKIYLRGADNLYPLTIEKVVNASPTGRRCANIMAKFIIGKGVEKSGEEMVNRSGETLNQIAKRAAQSIAKQYGVYFHVGYALDPENSVDEIKFKKNSTKVLDYVKMAKSKEDDDGFPGKFYSLDIEEKKNVFAKADDKAIWFYPYNTNSKVIASQMRNDCRIKGISNPTAEQMVTNYRGQVLYLNFTPEFQYALPLWDVVYDDMDTEYRISRYNNSQARNGWLGKTVVKKFADDEEEDERSTSSFNDVIKKNLGPENAADVLVIDVPVNAAEDVDKAFKIDQLKAQFDDKLFESTKKTLRENIMGSFNNVPEILIYAGSGALFGPNSDTYLEAKKFYWEQNEWERQELEEVLTELTGHAVFFLPLVKENEVDDDLQLRRKSQAELKGSVGGVTSLLAIQQAVVAGTTDINAGVEIIKEIYGIEEETARKMLGTPEKTTEDAMQ